MSDKQKLRAIERQIRSVSDYLLSDLFIDKNYRQKSIDLLQELGFGREAVFFETVSPGPHNGPDTPALIEAYKLGLRAGLGILWDVKYSIQDRMDRKTKRMQWWITGVSILLAVLSLLVSILSLK